MPTTCSSGAASATLPVHVSIFEPGFLRVGARTTCAPARCREQVKIQLYFGGAAPFGLPPTAASLDAYIAMLDGTGLPWMVGVIGGDVFGDGFAAPPRSNAGGHVRVGLEDFLGPTRPRNEDLVTAAVELVRDLGHEVATTEQTRELLVRS